MSAGLPITRRGLLGSSGALCVAIATGGLATACSAARAGPLPMTVHKDPNCGCCTAWAKAMTATGEFETRLIDEADMIAVKTRLRVPPELASCHTGEVGGYVIEGHVPVADVSRLLSEKPSGIIGLAVPGMPAGSPGMEMPDGRRDAYQVIAFTAAGETRTFASHG